MAGPTGNYQSFSGRLLSGAVVTLLLAALVVGIPLAQAATLTSVSVSGATNKTGVTETWTFQFTTVSAVPALGDFRVVFPAGFTVTNAVSACAASGLTFTTTVAGQAVTCQFVTGSVGATTAVTLTISNVGNPSTVQTTGVFTIQTRNALDAVIDDHLTATASITASTLTSVSLSGASELTGDVTTWTASFATVTAVAASGDIRIVFPTGFSLSSGSATACDVTAPLTVVGETTTISGQDAVCNLGALDSIAAGATVTLTLTNVQNPSTQQTTAAFTLQTRDSSNVVHDEHLTDTESITANTPGSVSVSAPLQTTGAVETWTFTMTPVNALADGADIRIVLPTGFEASSGSATACAIPTKTLTTNVASSTEVVCTLSGSTLSAGAAFSLTLDNVKNPTTAQTTGAFTIQLRDASDVLQESHTTDTEVIAAHGFTTLALSAPLQTAGAVETWTFALTTFNAVADGGDLYVAFPSGFTTSSGAATVCDIAGKSLTTAVPSSTEVVCTLSGSTLSANTLYSLTLTNVKNPALPQTTGVFTVQTRDAADAVHDADAAHTASIGPNSLLAVSASAPTQLTGATEIWTIAFTTVNEVPVGGNVYVEFPPGFAPSAGALCTINAFAPVLATVVGTSVTCALGLNSLAADDDVTVVIDDVVNPSTAQTTAAGDFVVQTRNVLNTVIDEDNGNVETIDPNVMSAVTVSAPNQVADLVETYTVDFTPSNAVAGDGGIRITLPAGFQTDPASACDITAPATVLAETTLVVSSTVILCVLGPADLIAAGAPVTLEISDITNPSTGGTLGPVILQTEDDAAAVHDEDQSVSLDIADHGALGVSLSAPLQTTGTIEEWTFVFTTVNDVLAAGRISIELPTGFATDAGAATECQIDVVANELTIAAGNLVLCQLHPTTDIPGGTLVTVVLTNVQNPTTAQTTGAFDVQTQEVSGGLLDQDSTQTAVITPSALGSVSVTAPIQVVGLTEDWTFEFTPVNTMTGGDVRIVLPAGFEADSGAATVCSVSAPPTAPGITTDVVSATEVLCEFDTLDTLAAGVPVTLGLTNLLNPAASGATGAFTIQTRDASDAIHDADTATTVDLDPTGPLSVVASATLQETGAVETWTIEFTTDNAVPSGGGIHVEFPTGFVADAGATECTVQGTPVLTVALLTSVDCLNIAGLTALEDVEVTISQMQNPTTEQTTGVFSVETREALGATIDSDASSVASIVASLLGAVAVSAPLQTAGSLETWTFVFTPVNTVAADGDVRIVLPAGFEASALDTVCASGLVPTMDTTVVSPTEVVCNLNLGALLAGQAATVTVSDVLAPATAQTTGAFEIETRDASDAVHDRLDTNTETIGAHPFSAGPTITAASRLRNALTTYTVSFTTFNTWEDDGRLTVTFPAGYTVNALCTVGTFTTDAGTAGVLGAPTVLGQQLTYTRSGGSDLAGGTAVSLTILLVKNPATAGQPAAFEIATTDSTGAEHDGASPNGPSILSGGGGGGGGYTPTPTPTPEPTPTLTPTPTPTAAGGAGGAANNTTAPLPSPTLTQDAPAPQVSGAQNQASAPQSLPVVSSASAQGLLVLLSGALIAFFSVCGVGLAGWIKRRR